MAKRTVGSTTAYDVQGAAAILDVHIETVRNMVREEKLPAVKIGRRYWILETSLEDLLQGLLPWQREEEQNRKKGRK